MSWNVTPRSLISGSRPEEGGDIFVRNVGNQLQNYTAPHLRRAQSTSSLTEEPQIYKKVKNIRQNERK